MNPLYIHTADRLHDKQYFVELLTLVVCTSVWRQKTVQVEQQTTSLIYTRVKQTNDRALSRFTRTAGKKAVSQRDGLLAATGNFGRTIIIVADSSACSQVYVLQTTAGPVVARTSGCQRAE
jgi:hypothetical protein